MPSTSARGPRTPTRTNRSAVACQGCRQRKVRCSLPVTGKPCIGCTQDRAECIVVPRQRKRGQKPDRMPGAGSVELAPGIDASTARDAQYGSGPTMRLSYPTHEGNPGGREAAVRTSSLAPSQGPRDGPRDTTARTEAEGVIEHEERSGVEVATAALGQPQENGQIPFYTGNQTGPMYAVDLCSAEESLPRHFLIPSHTQTTLSDADWSYLQRKGVLMLPGANACESLLRAYLHHVHPIMPVIEVDSILDFQRNGRLQEYNLLLLWSIIFVAVNFVPASVYEQEGYKSRKEMKATLYARTKCMYSVSEGMDKIVLLQSSLLMGFWISELDDHMQPWYWTGTAINLCLMLGLHRNPDSSKVNGSITDRQRCLWRRLWWCSFFRDRWLSLSYGRPLRINLHDCDTPMAMATDMLVDVAGIPESTSASFLPSGLSRLASYWVMLIGLSKQLGAVITMNYQVVKVRPTVQQFESLESEIVGCTLPDQYASGLTKLARFQSLHVHLHYQALLIAFYRPYGSETPIDLDPATEGDWQHRMRLKAGDAASKTNDIIDALAEDNLLEFAGPMTPSLLVPAMQTHLLFYRSADPLAKRLRLHKLEMCMLVMGEFQKVYTVASLYRGIFRKAMEQICPSYRTTSTSSNQHADSGPSQDPSGGNTTTDALAAAQLPTDLFGSSYLPVSDAEPESELADGFLDSLMDETSVFGFWDTWNRL